MDYAAIRAQELMEELDEGIERKLKELRFDGDFSYLEAKVVAYRSYILESLTILVREGRAG